MRAAKGKLLRATGSNEYALRRVSPDYGGRYYAVLKGDSVVGMYQSKEFACTMFERMIGELEYVDYERIQDVDIRREE